MSLQWTCNVVADSFCVQYSVAGKARTSRTLIRKRSMARVNVEIKARCSDPGRIRAVLKNRNGDFRGTDLQTDTYFKVSDGRLKLRQGNIENALIFYRRPDQAKPRKAEIWLCPLQDDSDVKGLLANALGVLVTVHKEREIYFIGNVKFHIDTVEKLGSFVEIEALGTQADLTEEMLHRQCWQYMELFSITQEDLIDCSYSDMLMHKEYFSAG